MTVQRMEGDLTLARGAPHEGSIRLVAPILDEANALPSSRALPEWANTTISVSF
jgi:hypothetical protein